MYGGLCATPHYGPVRVLSNRVSSCPLKVPSEEIYKALDGKAEILIDFTEKHQGIQIVNGEKGYFAVNEKGVYIIIDQKGRKLLDTEVGAWERPQQAGDYFLTSGSMHAGLVHRDTLEFQLFQLDDPSLHCSGKYLLGKWDIWQVIDTETGRIIYESPNKLVWPQKEGYVIEQPENGPQRIINLATGETEFETEEGQEIADGTDDFWLIQDGTCRFVLDAEYRIHNDWPLFRSASLGDGVVIGGAIEHATAADLKEYCGDGMYFEPDIRVFNREGEEVYWQDPINIWYLGSVGSTLVVQNTQDNTFTYRTVGPEGLAAEITTEYYSYLPEDGSPAVGYILAYKSVFREQDPLKPSAAPDLQKADEYRWTYLDGNLEPVTDFVFHGASMAENGYAVIYNEDGYAALIDLQQRGEK
ncbi:MAG: hypothetical protein IJ443_01445 [Firmicutes bacterium]|nr:hypothetical protein [Bacillota bacterium]